jgi:hypothetical protein
MLPLVRKTEQALAAVQLHYSPITFVRANGPQLAFAGSGVALGIMGLPYVPHSLCIFLGFIAYLVSAYKYDSQNLALFMMWGPAIPPSLYSLWNVFVYWDAHSIQGVIYSLLGALFFGWCGASLMVLVLMARTGEFGVGRDIPTPPTTQHTAQHTASVAHSRFAARQHPSVTDTEI